MKEWGQWKLRVVPRAATGRVPGPQQKWRLQVIAYNSQSIKIGSQLGPPRDSLQ